MRGSAGTDQIPGLKKDYEEDFKTALLRARGVVGLTFVRCEKA